MRACPACRCGAAGVHTGWRPPGFIHNTARGSLRPHRGPCAAAVDLPAGCSLPKAVECAALQVAGWEADLTVGVPALYSAGGHTHCSAWSAWDRTCAPFPCSCCPSSSCICRTQHYMESLASEEHFLAGTDDKFLTVAESPDSSLLGELLLPASEHPCIDCSHIGRPQPASQQTSSLCLCCGQACLWVVLAAPCSGARPVSRPHGRGQPGQPAGQLPDHHPRAASRRRRTAQGGRSPAWRNALAASQWGARAPACGHAALLQTHALAALASCRSCTFPTTHPSHTPRSAPSTF